MTDARTVPWDRPKLERLKKAYAGNKSEDMFWFEGERYVSRYAKYLIEYLEKELK